MRRKTCFNFTMFAAIATAAMLVSYSAVSLFPSGEAPGNADKPIAQGLVAPGLVEPASEEIEISASVVGRLTSVPVVEGQSVAAGQIIAEVENADLKAKLAQAQAIVERRQAELDKLRNGARQEERDRVSAEVAEATARQEQAYRELARKSPLAAQGVESQSSLDVAAGNAKGMKARLDALTAQERLVEAPARPEDIRIAEAALEEAQANVALAQAEIDKTIIRSPIDGVVLSRLRQTGETVTSLPPTLIARLGSTAHLRVRADVDESDIAQLKIGQRVWVTADAFRGQRFGGTIAQIGAALGKKNFLTERVTERVDTRILETLIDLDPGVHLPVGLQVDVWDDPSSAPAGRKSDLYSDDDVPLQPLVAKTFEPIAVDEAEAPVLTPPNVATIALLPEEPAQADAGHEPDETPQEPASRANGPDFALTATQDSWVELDDAQGRKIIARLLKQGESLDLGRSSGRRLTVGNAGGVELSIDGGPGQTLGAPGHVLRALDLTASGLVSGTGRQGPAPDRPAAQLRADGVAPAALASEAAPPK